MSPLVITLLIIGAVVVLLILAVVNNAVENSKLEKARQKADLLDRIRRCHEVSLRLPGQFIDSKLKNTLIRIELQLSERLLQIDKNNGKLKEQIATLKNEMANLANTQATPAKQAIASEEKAKEVRYTLETLHALINYAAQKGLLSANDGKEWVKRIRHMLVQLHIEYFDTVAQNALQQNSPGQARLAYERAVTYLRKQPDQATYQAPLKRFEEQLSNANALVLKNTKISEGDPAELTKGLGNLDDDWKKKNIYD